MGKRGRIGRGRKETTFDGKKRELEAEIKRGRRGRSKEGMRKREISYKEEKGIIEGENEKGWRMRWKEDDNRISMKR